MDRYPNGDGFRDGKMGKGMGMGMRDGLVLESAMEKGEVWVLMVRSEVGKGWRVGSGYFLLVLGCLGRFWMLRVRGGCGGGLVRAFRENYKRNYRYLSSMGV